MMAERRKVSVVGAGNVGATLAYASLIRGTAKTRWRSMTSIATRSEPRCSI